MLNGEECVCSYCLQHCVATRKEGVGSLYFGRMPACLHIEMAEGDRESWRVYIPVSAPANAQELYLAWPPYIWLRRQTWKLENQHHAFLSLVSSVMAWNNAPKLYYICVGCGWTIGNRGKKRDTKKVILDLWHLITGIWWPLTLGDARGLHVRPKP